MKWYSMDITKVSPRIWLHPDGRSGNGLQFVWFVRTGKTVNSKHVALVEEDCTEAGKYCLSIRLPAKDGYFQGQPVVEQVSSMHQVRVVLKDLLS